MLGYGLEVFDAEKGLFLEDVIFVFFHLFIFLFSNHLVEIIIEIEGISLLGTNLRFDVFNAGLRLRKCTLLVFRRALLPFLAWRLPGRILA